MGWAKDKANHWRSLENSFIAGANREFSKDDCDSRIVVDGLAMGDNSKSVARFYEVLDEGGVGS